MPELFLIAHKVRGEPAFDIAIKTCQAEAEAAGAGEASPCQPDCGGWHEGKCKFASGWIIPTSGHAAKPFASIPLRRLKFCDEAGIWSRSPLEEPGLNIPPPDWPDHYSANDRKPKPPSPKRRPAPKVPLSIEDLL